MSDRIFDTETKRQPPRNIEAERALLGAILMNNRAIERVGEFLRPHHFADPANGLIYDACAQLIGDNKPADIVTLRGMIDGSALIEDAGGMQYIVTLAAAAVTVINAEHYGRQIYDVFLRREAIALGTDMVNAGYDAPIDADFPDAMEGFEGKLLKLTGTLEPTGGLMPFSEVLQTTYAQWERETKGGQGVPTGFVDVDKLMGGLHATDLIVIGGRASMGKTSIAVNIAFNVAEYFRTCQDLEHKGKQVAFFSLEMSAQQLGGRIITGQTSIIAPRNRWGSEMDMHEWKTVLDLAQTHGNLPFWVDDSADTTVPMMRGRCVRLHRRKRLGLIVVDYLQLMESEGKRGGQMNRVEQVSQITRGLKKMAKELKVPVIALSQLSRAVESRENKRPILSDLRESGSVEQDADIIIFPFRQEYYLNQEGKPVRTSRETDEGFSGRVIAHHQATEAHKNKCEFAIAKNRHGPLGTVDIYFDNKRTWFENLSKRDPGPEDQPGLGI